MSRHHVDELKSARDEVSHDRQQIHRVHHLYNRESCDVVRRREHERQDSAEKPATMAIGNSDESRRPPRHSFCVTTPLDSGRPWRGH